MFHARRTTPSSSPWPNCPGTLFSGLLRPSRSVRLTPCPSVLNGRSAAVAQEGKLAAQGAAAVDSAAEMKQHATFFKLGECKQATCDPGQVLGQRSSRSAPRRRLERHLQQPRRRVPFMACGCPPTRWEPACLVTLVSTAFGPPASSRVHQKSVSESVLYGCAWVALFAKRVCGYGGPDSESELVVTFYMPQLIIRAPQDSSDYLPRHARAAQDQGSL